MSSASELRARRQMRWQLAQLAKLASISLALIAPAAAASPVTMRLASRALGAQPSVQTTPTLGLQRRNADSSQGLGTLEEATASEMPTAVGGPAALTKDQGVQHAALQQTASKTPALATNDKRPMLRQFDQDVDVGVRAENHMALQSSPELSGARYISEAKVPGHIEDKSKQPTNINGPVHGIERLPTGKFARPSSVDKTVGLSSISTPPADKHKDKDVDKTHDKTSKQGLRRNTLSVPTHGTSDSQHENSRYIEDAQPAPAARVRGPHASNSPSPETKLGIPPALTAVIATSSSSALPGLGTASSSHSEESPARYAHAAVVTDDRSLAAAAPTSAYGRGRKDFDFAASTAVPVPVSTAAVLMSTHHRAPRTTDATSALVPVVGEKHCDHEEAGSPEAHAHAADEYIKWLRRQFDDLELEVPADEAPTAATKKSTASPAQQEGQTEGPGVSEPQYLEEDLRLEKEALDLVRAQVQTLQQRLQDQVSVNLEDPSDARSPCKTGYTGLKCKVCAAGYHGDHCELTGFEESFRKQIEARMSDDTASSEVSEKTANVQESFNDNAPAHRPRAVPAHVRRDEDKNSELGGGAEQKGSIVSFEDAIFGVRLLTAIHKEHRELLDRMRARHKLGAELLKTRQMLKDSQHLRELGVGEGGGNGAVYLVGKELAPSRYNSFYQTPKNAHFSIGHPEASHENKHSRKHPFTQASGRTTQLIARTASSTLRAAGVAVSKLLSAAGKALAEEAKSDLSDQIDEPADHTDNGIAEESKEATSRRPQQGNWRKFFSRFRSTVKGAQEDIDVSAEDQAFAQFFQGSCRERGGAECAQDARSAYKLLEQSRRQNVHLQEANLWGGLLAKRLELARNNPDRARMGAAVWAPGKWAGVFVQDAYTKMEMELEISAVSPDGPCSGFITWSNGHSVTAFEGSVRGNQINFEETRVVSDYSGGNFVPGTRYRLWKDGGDHADMEGTWIHSELMVWGYLNLKTVHHALMPTEVDTDGPAKEETSSAAHRHAGLPAVCTSGYHRDDCFLATGQQVARYGVMTPSEISGDVAHKTVQNPKVSMKEPAQVGNDTWLGLLSVVLLTTMFVPSARTMLRQYSARVRVSLASLWARLSGRQSTSKPKDAVETREAHRGASTTPQIDIPAEAFRAVGRSVLRHSSSSLSSPASSTNSSKAASDLSPKTWPSLHRARELLLSSSVKSSAPSCTSSLPMTSSADSCDYQNRDDEEEEQELTSVVELEELRKSLGDDHSFLLPSTPHDLDASWVIHEEMDASTGFTDGGAKKNCPDNTARISPALSAQSKGPRMSDLSGAPTDKMEERRESGFIDHDNETSISLGWLAVEDAQEANVFELPSSVDNY